MVGKVIRDYMEGGAKKLTVPGFGTFMRREGGEVIFVDLVRKDDGVLREMVEDEGGYSEVEAMALIDRFIFETRNAIERNGSASIKGFGEMTFDHKGLYQFNHSPKGRPVRESAVQEKLFEKDSPRPVQPSARPAAQDVRQSAHGSVSARSLGQQSARPAPRQPQSGPRRGIPAGKPQKSGGWKHCGKQSGTDTILVVAIVAAVIALAVMAYAFSAGNMPFMQK